MSEISHLTPKNGTEKMPHLSTLCPIRRPDNFRTRILAQVDVDTGEVVAWLMESLTKPPRKKDFLKLYMAVCVQLARSEAFGAEARVIFWLMANVQFGNFVCLTQREIATTLGVTRRTVSRVISKLKESGVLHDDELRGMSGFRLNPNLMFCGQPGSQARERQRWERMLADREKGRDDQLPAVAVGSV
jgi:DNA-binding XRE family transcriptional regulator